MPRLTKTFVDRTPLPLPLDGEKYAQAFYRDSTLLGFGLRINSGGTKTFIVETRVKGRVKRITIGKYGALTCEQARLEAKKILGQIAQGLDPVAEKRIRTAKTVTLQQAFDDYLTGRRDLKLGTVKDYRRCIEVSLNDWLSKQLIDVDKSMVETRHEKLGKNSHARANNVMRVLRAIFNFAKTKYENTDGTSVFTSNPVDRLSQNRSWYTVNRRRTLIKPHELKPWHDAVVKLNWEVTQDYLLFLLFTGLRRTEAAKLTWDRVDLNQMTLTISDTKNSEPHSLPLTTFLSALLTRRFNSKSSIWVFPSPIHKTHLSEPREAIKKVAKVSGVDFTLHDLRRTFITIAESLDIPAYALKQLLNHKNSNDVTAGYIVSDVNRLRNPMQVISTFIENQFEAKVETNSN